MRLHSKPWAEPELQETSFFVEEPEKRCGHWREAFPAVERPLHLEIGCGKCVQMAQMAHDNPDVDYVALDEARKILAVGCRTVKQLCGEHPDNVFLTWGDAAMLTDYFSAADSFERIYVSFPNPWTQRAKQHKRRLTHPRQLMLYREIMTADGEVWFKTDDEALFRDSKTYFAQCGFSVRYCTDDLAASGFAPNYESEHERMFKAEGKPIHFLIAHKEELSAQQIQDMALKRRPYKEEGILMEKEFKKTTRKLIDFLATSPTAFQAVANIGGMLDKNGFTRLQEGEKWTAEPGSALYVTRNMSSILAVRMPLGTPKSVMVAASHTDSPMFKVKANAENEAFGHYIRLNTEGYGGGILSSWFDRPLSIAGRVITQKDGVFGTALANIDRDLCLIPNVAIHMKRDLNDGYKINKAVDTVPLFGEISAKGQYKKCLAEAAGVTEEEIVSADMFLYDRTGGRIWGAQEEFFSSPRIDNLQCAYTTLQGFLAAKPTQSTIQVYAAFDNEETGSATKQGAASPFLFDTLTRLCECAGTDLHTMLASSFMLSADNGHAMHPNHPEYADKDNTPHMNGGVVIKYNASQRYTTDAISAAIFESICKSADVPVQIYANRSDLAGGGTLGSISNTRVSMNTVDIGLAQLAMHSCYETGGCKDSLYMINAVKAFYGTTITCTGDGRYAVAQEG